MGLKNLMARKITGKRETSGEELLSLELSEIEQIAERLFLRIEDRIAKLEEIERRVDKKISLMELELTRTEPMGNTERARAGRRHGEVRELAKKGLKIDDIAGILDMPKGEVELILGLAG